MNSDHVLFPLRQYSQPSSPFTSSPIVLRHGRILQFLLDITASEGTTETLDIKFQYKSAAGTWVDWLTTTATFAQQIAAGQARLVVNDLLTAVNNSIVKDTPPMEIRAVATLGADADEKFTFALVAQEMGG